MLRRGRCRTRFQGVDNEEIVLARASSKGCFGEYQETTGLPFGGSDVGS